LIGCGYSINTQTYITKADLNEKQIFFTWRKKHTTAEIYQQYLDKVYVLKLVLCKFFPEYGNAICNQACSHNCQHYFRNEISVLQEGMLEWWR